MGKRTFEIGGLVFAGAVALVIWLVPPERLGPFRWPLAVLAVGLAVCSLLVMLGAAPVPRFKGWYLGATALVFTLLVGLYSLISGDFNAALNGAAILPVAVFAVGSYGAARQEREAKKAVDEKEQEDAAVAELEKERVRQRALAANERRKERERQAQEAARDLENANLSVPFEPVEPRLERLEQLLAEGGNLADEVADERRDEFPHFRQPFVEEVGRWHERASKELFPWSEYAAFAHMRWPVRADGGRGRMVDIRLGPLVNYLETAIDFIKVDPPIAPDIFLLRRLYTKGDHLQDTLANGYETWSDTEFTNEVGGWWHDVFDALRPWPVEQRTFPAMKTGPDDHQPDLANCLRWIEKFIRRLEGK